MDKIKRIAYTQYGIMFLIIILGGIVGGLLWPYTINTWLVYFGEEPQVVWWQGALLGFVPLIGKLTIFFAVATWILMLFL